MLIFYNRKKNYICQGLSKPLKKLEANTSDYSSIQSKEFIDLCNQVQPKGLFNKKIQNLYDFYKTA